MDKIENCVFGNQAAAIRPASLWQIRLGEFVNLLEATWPQKKPKFDWKMYGGMPWAGQPTLWGMEFHGVIPQIPNYALHQGDDWINKYRFFSCFIELGGHIMKCWTDIQLQYPTRTIHFFNLIENNTAIRDFVRMIRASYLLEAISPMMIAQLVDVSTGIFPANPQLQPYGHRTHASDVRLYARQAIANSLAFKIDLTRYLLLVWIVDFLPPTVHVTNKEMNRHFKASWLPLGKSLQDQASKWFDMESHVLDESTTFETVYRKSLNPMFNLSNGRSSAVCSMAYSLYMTYLAEIAGRFNKELDVVERIICTRGTARIICLFAQLIATRLAQSQGYTKTLNYKNTSLVEGWIQANIRMMD